ncbi:hypothetical protein PINS_up011987 [Pythium insidiosum]|nr:hypothetical protein PINS_up011987 [Pythium insidiosum]
MYPNDTIDSVVIEGMDDASAGGLVFYGRKDQDVVLFTRIRRCINASACETLAVDDYRHEAALHTMSVVDWRSLITLLRGTGQVDTPFHRHNVRDWVLHLLRTLFLIPGQVIVYGSVFPIACYVIAHLVDVSAVYEFVARHYSTPLGVYRFKLNEVVQLGAVSMRSVWILAATCHALVAVSTRRSWSPHHGIAGIPEFFMTLVASSTIFAHVRSTSFRVSRVVDAVEIPASLSLVYTRGAGYENTRGVLRKLVMGITVDVQFISTSLAIAATLVGLSWLAHRILPQLVRYKVVMLSHTLVPYSAGSLWLTNALVVSWCSTIIKRATASNPTRIIAMGPSRKGVTVAVQSITGNPRRRGSSKDTLFMSRSTASTRYQRDMAELSRRSAEIEAWSTS